MTYRAIWVHVPLGAPKVADAEAREAIVHAYQ